MKSRIRKGQKPVKFLRTIFLFCGLAGLQGLLLPLVLVDAFQVPTSLASTRISGSLPGSGGKILTRISPLNQPKSYRGNIAQRSSSNSDNSSKENGPSKRQRVVLKLKNAVTGTTKRIINLKSNLSSNFAKLSKTSKRIVVVYMLIVGLIFGMMGRTAYQRAANPQDFPVNKRPIEVTYSSFMDLVEQQRQQQQQQQSTSSKTTTTDSDLPQMDNVKISPDRISYRLSKPVDGDKKYLNAYTRKVHASPQMIDYLRENNMEFTAASQQRSVLATYTLRSLMATLYIMFLWRMYQTMRSASGGGSSKDVPGKLLDSDVPLASFNDIQGIDDAKFEVMELVDTLRHPEKYAILGARAPTGLLLEGPPGTGKTMLARATAASAGVPLLYVSGSDFVEMYVGRGAGRVRRMFDRATKLAPCIIFIDELDTLGKARDSGNGLMGNMASRSNDEADQTLNQLLSCMDGLDSSRRICVLAATNRKDVLDQALIRPGRFDRIVKLSLPNAQGRENILRVHAKKLPGFEEGKGVDPDRMNSLGKGNKVDLSAVAAVTEGLSGAELEFIVNEAAIRAVRRVSSALRAGTYSENTSSAQVEAADFEASVQNFYQTRRKGSGNVGDVWKNVFKG